MRARRNAFDRYNKLHIKHMILCKRSNRRKNVVDIAILLDNNQYVEYSMPFKQKYLTIWVADRIKQLFLPFVIDSKTDVMVNKIMNDDHPLFMYLSLLRPHVQFKLRSVSIDQIISRIYYFYTGKTATKRKFNVVWRQVLDKGTCPWITKEVDYAIQNRMPLMQRVMKTLRLGLFYMVVKNYLYNKSLKSILSKTA